MHLWEESLLCLRWQYCQWVCGIKTKWHTLVIPESEMLKNMFEGRKQSFFWEGFQFYFAFLSCIYRLTCCFHKAVCRIQPGLCVCCMTAIWGDREVQAHLCLFPSQGKVVTGSQAVTSWGKWLIWANMPGSPSEKNKFSPSLLLHPFVQRKWNVVSKVFFQMKEICGLRRVPQSAVYFGFLVWLLMPWTLVHFSLL